MSVMPSLLQKLEKLFLDSKNITWLRTGCNKQNDYLMLLHHVSNKVIVYLNMLCPLMKNKIIGNVQSSLITTKTCAEHTHFTKERLNSH